jgi:uncharacterized protein YwgA
MSETFTPQEETLLLLLKCFRGQIKGIKRLQKLIFLSQHKGVIDSEAKFIFAPYLRGPFSTDCMDTLTELSQRGFIQIRRVSDNNHSGYHSIQLTEKGASAVSLIRPSQGISDLLEHYSTLDTERLTEDSYKEFYRAITPTMLYINVPAIDEVTCYPLSPHWRSSIGERIKLSVPISKTAALDEKDVAKLERIRNIAAVFTSTRQILNDWKVRRLVPGCIVRTYGVFLDVRQASLGLIGKFSHSLTPSQDSIIDAVIDGFGKVFFVDDGAETLLSYVVELCGEVSVSVTHPAINALYILGYEVANPVRRHSCSSGKKNMMAHGDLGFRQADENFGASSMFT